MSRLIDANKVVKAILAERDKIPRTVPAASYELVSEKPFNHGNSMRGGIRKALRCIEQTPTVDAVLVVRCWECDYSSMEGWYCTGCGLMPAHKTFPHEYCSHGNPKEDSNNG